MAQSTGSDEEASSSSGRIGSFRPGVPVDAGGNPTIDPTENVKSLNEAANKRQDDLRDYESEVQTQARRALEKHFSSLREADIRFDESYRTHEDRFHNYARDAESTRVNQLADLRQVYETRIAEMLSESVKSTSTLVSTQLVQIQATFDKRVSELEQFRWAAGGRASVADPATENAIARLASNITSLTEATASTLAKMASSNSDAISKLGEGISSLKTADTGVARQSMGRSEVVAWFAAGAFGLAAIIVPIMIAVFTHHAP